MRIESFNSDSIDAVKLFSDKTIGENYFSNEQLQDILKRSQLNGKSASLILLDEDNLVKGIRLSYPQGQWMDLKEKNKINPQLWKIEASQMAYFQSIFMDSDLRGQGWGKKLSLASMDILKNLGAKGIVCHSWKESPHNSSMRYLQNLGFEEVAELKKYWFEVDYDCVRCGKPCLCTATEMVFYL